MFGVRFFTSRIFLVTPTANSLEVHATYEPLLNGFITLCIIQFKDPSLENDG